MLLVEEYLCKISIHLTAHLLVRGLSVVVPALKLIKVPEPFSVELLAPGNLSPELVLKHGTRRDVIRRDAQDVVVPFVEVPSQCSVVVAVDFEVFKLFDMVQVTINGVDLDALVEEPQYLSTTKPIV